MEKLERIVLVDIIRGFALLGLFIVHMVEYFELYWYKPGPGWVHDSVFFIFAGKAYALFALMFGFSFYILVDRRSSLFHRKQFAWRMALLLAMGYLHSLLYAGDILQLLALGGFYLLAIHRLNTKLLTVIATVLLLQIPTFIQFVFLLPDDSYQQPKFWAMMGSNFQVFAHASLPDLITYNAWQGQQPKWVLTFETGGVWSLLGLFTLGLIMGRLKIFENTQPKYRIFIALLASVALFGLFYTLQSYQEQLIHSSHFMVNWLISGTFAKYFGLCAIAFYISFFFLLYLHAGKILRSLVCPLAAVGRMSLTFYIGQSLIFVPLFYGFGAGWYATVGQLNALILALFASAMHIIIANIWLARFTYGPFEAIWRSATQRPFK